ncbi:MAG: hypothetical protein E7634_07300 [Ruminococcaceae bacterium]|nr:hypothetical protein [Oscillospiraceae bacterium]
MEITRLPDIRNLEENEDIEEIRSYLIRLSRGLGSALENISEENISKSLRQKGFSATEKEIGKLKNDIIRTAEEIRSTGEKIALRLSSEYVAKSEIGQYAENAFQQIEINGKGVTQYFEELSSISQRVADAESSASGADKKSELLSVSLQKINAYVRTGKLAEGVYGIEIGNFTDGENAPYKVRLSENRLAFYIGNEEVAYFSDDSMYISRASIPISLTVGDCLIKNDDGLVFAYK